MKARVTKEPCTSCRRLAECTRREGARLGQHVDLQLWRGEERVDGAILPAKVGLAAVGEDQVRIADRATIAVGEGAVGVVVVVAVVGERRRHEEEK